MIRCMGCMEEFDDSLDTCPHCGYKRGTPPKEAYHLPPETILNGRYIVGRVLGFGGFGVTYIGWDCVLEHKVAIKEYLPSDFSTRVPGETAVSVYDGEMGEQFEAGLHSFIDEAHRLAQFNHENGIVHIYDAFAENNTAYIIMEYLDGETLRDLLQRENKIPYQQAIEYMLPVLRALESVHQAGIIHRDIAPDNIFLTKDGNVKLIDFGASRYATTLHSKSLSVILKQGYAPEEQYRSRGEQGPYSDVYACCATLYRAITGIVPEDALERKANDTLKPPSKLGVDIPESVENVILNGMNVHAQNRIQKAKELADLLTAAQGGEAITRNKEIQVREDVGKWKKRHKILAASSAAAVLTAIILGVTGVFGIANTLDTSDYAVVPDYIGMTMEEAQSAWETYCETEGIQNVTLQTAEGVTVDEVSGYEVDQIYATDPVSGQWFKRVSDTAAYVYATVVLPSIDDSISQNAGKTSWSLVDLANYSLADAQAYLNSMDGVEYTVVAVPSEKAKDVVLNTVPGAGATVNKGDTVTIYVSDGSQMSTVETFTRDEIREENKREEETTKKNTQSRPDSGSNGSQTTEPTTKPDTRVSVPNFVNQTAAGAAQQAASLGLRVQLAFCYSDTYAENRVARQSVSSGTKVEKNTSVTLWVSSGSADDAWSAWSTTRPGNGVESRTQTQYRYRTRTSSQKAVYGSWSSTSWYDSQQSTSDTRQYVGTRQVETQKHYKTQWKYSRWVGTCNGKRRYGAIESDIAMCSNRYAEDTGFRDYSLAVIGTSSGSSHATMYEGYWYNQETRQVYTHSDYKTQYGYQTRSKSYTTEYGSWGSWSSWGTTRYTETSTRDVESRTVYSYREDLPVYN